MKETMKNNPMMCDPVTGICEIPTTSSSESDIVTESKNKPLKLIYFTDPICSSCWGIEPQLRKLKLEYGEYFDIEYRMGGLLKSWESYGGRDVNGPQSVAQHWEEAGAYYDMPIDGDVWLEDPLDSSYPPSIAVKAAQLQDGAKALAFLRRIKEMVFLEKKNITREVHLQEAAVQSGLDASRLKADSEGLAMTLFEEDLALGRALGVRGFPTIFFTDAEGNRFLVYGSQPYERYEQALLKLCPDAEKKSVDTSYESLFKEYPTMTTKELSVLTGKTKAEVESDLDALSVQNSVDRSNSKNGVVWKHKADVRKVVTGSTIH